MSSGNGQTVIRIGRKGKRLFALGDGEQFEVDVVLAYNQWVDLYRSCQNEKGEVSPDSQAKVNALAAQFVIELSGTQDLTMAEVLEFLAVLHTEVVALQGFLEVTLPGVPASPKRSASIVLE